MSKCLVVVESPAKAKTIEKYLGKNYQVLASYGHVRDLPAKQGSVIPTQHFHMIYTPIEKHQKYVEAIARSLKKSDTLLLATDPDREGEAISWHVYELMRERKLLTNKTVQRIVFNEITQSAVTNALKTPRDISMNLVNAQQARRALDYLVGFNLSPLLWKKIKRGLSAGRVQSPALRLIVEREEEIERFISQEYWDIKAQCEYQGYVFEARLIQIKGKKLQPLGLKNESMVKDIKDQLLKQIHGQLTVTHVERKERLRKPPPPFITSTLQQEAVRKLGFTTRKTMLLAQQLYEGIETPSGIVGLITYMRTDSVHMAAEALKSIREVIVTQYGSSFCPEIPRFYQTKSKNAQEAHEAIRPTDFHLSPHQLARILDPEQLKLYTLIWKRTLACQMTDAILDTVAIDLSAHPDHLFRVNGSTIRFPGFLTLYEESKDNHKEEETAFTLPPFEKGSVVILQDLLTTQHFTEPPPRYTEASLVKALEEYDIGRPSTYASIIQTLQHRDYAVKEKKYFVPTDVGRIVNRFLKTYFPKYIDYQFTAALENTLDSIARGEQAWIPILDAFWEPFIHLIEQVDVQVKRQDVTSEVTQTPCPECSKPLCIRLGKKGRFLGCSAYPDCHYTASLVDDKATVVEPTAIEGRNCPLCHHPLYKRAGRYGAFIGCSQYPQCKYIESLHKSVETGVLCPQCKTGHMVSKPSRYGKIFYACDKYPTCQYAIWYPPVNKPCPRCHWPILIHKTGKRIGNKLVCPQKDCEYEETVE